MLSSRLSVKCCTAYIIWGVFGKRNALINLYSNARLLQSLFGSLHRAKLFEASSARPKVLYCTTGSYSKFHRRLHQPSDKCQWNRYCNSGTISVNVSFTDLHLQLPCAAGSSSPGIPPFKRTISSLRSRGKIRGLRKPVITGI
jgi:hypothetical protein